MKNLDVGLLRTFLTVAQLGGMTAAAVRLHLTQSAVSQQIARLESLTGGTLFDRQPGRVALNHRGHRMRQKAAELVALNDKICSDWLAPEMSGEVRLGIPYDLIDSRFRRALEEFTAHYPNVDVVLSTGSSNDLADLLDRGQLDLALLEQRAEASCGELLAVEPLVWVGKPGGRAFDRRPLPLCLVSETCVFRPAIFRALEQDAVPWKIIFNNASIEATAMTVASDLAVTAWLKSTVPAGLAILDPDAVALPALPHFSVVLRSAEVGAPAIALMRDSIWRAFVQESDKDTR